METMVVGMVVIEKATVCYERVLTRRNANRVERKFDK